MPSGGPPKKQKSTVSEFASGLDGVVLKSTTGKGKKRKMKKTKAAVHR